MRKLELDYQHVTSRVTWASWVLLMAGLLLCIDMGLSYTRLHRKLEGFENIIRTTPGMREVVHKEADKNFSPAELAKARQTIDKIAVPWSALFNAVESVKNDRVTLLALEPDSKEGTLSLTGEARDFPALLTYIAQLGQVNRLHDVYLQHHEIRQDDPKHAVAFLIVARWGAKP